SGREARRVLLSCATKSDTVTARSSGVPPKSDAVSPTREGGTRRGTKRPEPYREDIEMILGGFFGRLLTGQSERKRREDERRHQDLHVAEVVLEEARGRDRRQRG